MKLFKLYPLIFLIASNAFASVVENYEYPYKDPYLATLTYEIMKSDRPDISKYVVIPGLPSRSKIALLEGRNTTRVKVYQQKKMAPMAFLLTGTGSLSSDAGVNSQAEILFDLGYHVVVFPSPMNWTYILSENLTGTPGYTPDEARSLYNYMQKVMGIINANNSFKISGYVLAGYSLGAGEAAFISEIDRVEKVYDFKKILLVNPPLDIFDAVNTLDKLLYVAAKWSQPTINYVQSLIYGNGANLLNRDYKNPNYFKNLDKTPFGNSDYDKYLIGAAFRMNLGDVIFVNQQIKDTGVLKMQATKGSRSDREDEAHTLSFRDFATKLVIPNLKQEDGLNGDIDEIFHKASVESIKEKLASNPRVFIFHNEDDFLTKPDDLNEFKAVMGDRMTLFPLGGHLGNMWFPENTKLVRAFFQNPN